MTSDRPLTGIDALSEVFARARQAGRAAFLPYFPIGYPDYEASIAAVEALSQAGADAFEIGMPFSDPLADGPTIQAATTRALNNGITVHHCIEAVAELRRRGIGQPMLLMGYLNPILAYGPERFVVDAHTAGIDGFIIPDLPPEERSLLEGPTTSAGLALVGFVTPNASESRIALAVEGSTGFIYVVSVTGVTGARDALPDSLPLLLARLRSRTDKPLVVGFGISNPDQARAISSVADGFIVGSALVRKAAGGTDAVRDLAYALRRSLDQ